MKKYFKLIGIPFLIAVAIFLFIKLVWLREFNFKDMTVEEYVTLYNSNSEGIIYVTEDEAVMKSEFEEAIAASFSSRKVAVYKLDLTKTNDEEKEKFLEANEFTSDKFTIPMLIYVKNGVIIDKIDGYAPEYVIEQFITDNNIE